MDENILWIIKKEDGTYLFGGTRNNIYQLNFDEYGFVDLVSKLDSGFGDYEDDPSGNCIYSCFGSGHEKVGFIKEMNNGDVITISDYSKKKKIWKL